MPWFQWVLLVLFLFAGAEALRWDADRRAEEEFWNLRIKEQAERDRRLREQTEPPGEELEE